MPRVGSQVSSLGSGIYGTSVPWPEHERLCRHVTLCGSHKVNEKGGGQWCFKCGQLPTEMLLGDHVSCKCLQVTVTLKYLVQIQRNAHSMFYLSAFKRRLPYERSTTFLGQPSEFSQKRWSLQEALTFRSSKASLLVHITQRGISQCLIFTFASNFINTDHWENWCRY